MKNKIKVINESIKKYYTDKVIYRGSDICDLFFLYNASKNKDFVKFLLWSGKENFDNFFNENSYLIKEKENNDIIFISCLEKTKGTWIGVIKLMPYKDSFALSLWISSDFWKTNYSLETADILISILFKEFNLEKIYALTQVDYSLMKRVFRAYNFTLTDKNIVLKHENGNKLDFLEYCVEKHQYKINEKYYKIDIE